MDFNAVKEYIEQNKESNEELKAYLRGLFSLSVEEVQKFIAENADAKKWFDSERDKFFSKSLETWKTNNLQKLIDEEIKKKFPSKDPKDIELEKLKAEIESIRAEAKRKELTNLAIKTATEKKLPADLIDYLIGEDEQSTLANIGKLEEVFGKYVQTAVEERLKSGSYTPPANGGSNTTFTKEQIAKMTPDEINKHWDTISKMNFTN